MQEVRDHTQSLNLSGIRAVFEEHGRRFNEMKEDNSAMQQEIIRLIQLFRTQSQVIDDLILTIENSSERGDTRGGSKDLDQVKLTHKESKR